MSTPSSQRVEHSSRTTEPVDDGASAITVDDEAISAPQLTDAEWQRVKVIRLRPVLADSAKNALAGIAGTLLIALLSWHGAGSTYDPLVPWVWWLAYMAIGVWIIAIAKRFAGSRNQGVDVVLAMRQLFMPTVAAGFVWGSSAWLMLPAPGSQVELVIVIGHAMVLMAVVNGRSTDRPSLLAFVIPATGVFVLGLVRLGDTFHLALSLGFLVFTVALVSFARVREEAVDTAVQLRIRTENLLRERTVQHRLTEEALRDAERSREQAQRATESAMRANHEKSNFMAAIGHDLRQPMHALVQYHGHLLRSDKDPALASAIYGIGKSLDSMRDLLDSIAEVSRLMTGLVKPTLSTFELSPLLTRLEAQAQPMAEEKGLTFSIGRVAAIVQSDEVLLERILRNLVVNAIRYTESGHVAVRATVRANRLVVCVADSGIGIAATDKERIFEPFYQVANSARDRRMGLGLGLSIVRHLSDLLGISVRVRSHPGGGSVFALKLPTSTNVPWMQSSPKVAACYNYAQGAIVVLIDDNDESLVATASSLELFGCRVLTARSSTDALDKLRAQPLVPQLVISDHRLINETGLDAVSAVLEHQHRLYGEEIDFAVLILTGDTAPQESERVSAAGYRMFHKPLTTEGLYRAVNEALEAIAFPQTSQGRDRSELDD